jgi:hypothetical protein
MFIHNHNIEKLYLPYPGCLIDIGSKPVDPSLEAQSIDA